MVSNQALKLIHEEIASRGVSPFTIAVDALLDEYYILTAHLRDTEAYISSIHDALDDAESDADPRDNA